MPVASLATTALEDFWDSSKPLVFLGDWCFRNLRTRSQHPHAVVLDYPWNVSDRALKDFYYCKEIYEGLLQEVTVVLNEIHCTAHTNRYWRIIVGPWLDTHIQTLYERYVTIRAALERYPELASICLDVRNYQTPTDIYNYYEMRWGDSFNLQLYSHILAELGIGVSYRDNFEPPRLQANQGIKQWIARCLLSPLSRMMARRSSIILVDTIFNHTEEFRLFLSSGFRIRPLVESHTFWKMSGQPLKECMRRAFSSIKPTDEFSRILINSLQWAMPCSYVEEYSQVVRTVKGRWPSCPKLILSSLLFYFHEYGKVWMAEQAEVGCKIISAQHGGSYGIFERCFGSYHEPTIADESWSWGWSRENAPNVKPMPSPKLNRGLRVNANSSRVLILPWSTPRYADSFMRSPFGSQMQLYYEDLGKFFGALEKRLQSSMFIRPHAEFDNLDDFLTEFEWLRRDDTRTSFPRSLSDCRIAVVGYLGTTFLEVLAADVPSIFFWKEHDNNLHSDVEPYFRLLWEAKVLHYSAIDAANHLNSVYDAPLQWWHSDAVRDAKSAFLRRFGCMDRNWLDTWKVEILKRAALPQSDVVKLAI